MPSSSLISDSFIAQFREAAAEGTVLELKMRLLADKIPELQAFAHSPKLENIEKEMENHFGDQLSDEEKEILALCRQLRNKILHCNFSVAREKLQELGIRTERGGVRGISVAGLSPQECVRKIEEVVSGTPGSYEEVADTKTTTSGSIFGWLLEMGRAGDFEKAEKVFKSAAEIMDRLARLPLRT